MYLLFTFYRSIIVFQYIFGYFQVCDSLSFGKREDKQLYNKRSSFCFRCCHDDLCNNSCDDPMSTPATSG